MAQGRCAAHSIFNLFAGSQRGAKGGGGMTNLYALTQRDYDWFERSTITRPIAEKFAFRVDDVEGAAQVGQKLTALRPMRGIIFRYFSAFGGHERERRLRRDIPDVDSNGKESAKYIGPPDRPPLLFYPLLVEHDVYRTWL